MFLGYRLFTSELKFEGKRATSAPQHPKWCEDPLGSAFTPSHTMAACAALGMCPGLAPDC